MIPQKTPQIFDMLSKGKFLCDNYPEATHRVIYNLVDDNYDDLYEYFLNIGYVLNRDIGYFYFTRDDNSSQIESKINSILKFIDLLDFMFEYSSSFGVGTKITPSVLVDAVQGNAILKTKLIQSQTIQ